MRMGERRMGDGATRRRASYWWGEAPNRPRTSSEEFGSNQAGGLLTPFDSPSRVPACRRLPGMITRSREARLGKRTGLAQHIFKGGPNPPETRLFVREPRPTNCDPCSFLQLIIVRAFLQRRVQIFTGLFGGAVFVDHLLDGFGNVVDHITPVNCG